MNLRVFPTPAAAAHAAADFVAACLRSAPADAPLVLAVSGGSTPGPLYRRLATLEVRWERLHVVWVDDRCVPHAHHDSNVRLLRETLLATAPILPTHVHPVDTAQAPEEAAAAYDARLRRLLGPDGGVTVAVLGMGDDGHTASLFPGAALDHGDRLAVHTHAPPASPVRGRVTLTLALLNRSRHAVFLASGPGKAAPLSDVRAGACPALPAACVAAQDTVWFVDEAAAGPSAVLG